MRDLIIEKLVGNLGLTAWFVIGFKVTAQVVFWISGDRVAYDF